MTNEGRVKGSKFGRRAPKPLEMWITSAFAPWHRHSACGHPEWLSVLQQIARDTGCEIVFDPAHHWRESRYCPGDDRRRPVILVGGAGNPKHCCTALLHELGHHLLLKAHHAPKGLLDTEEAAWRLAQDLALQYRLPILDKTRRESLYTHKYALLQQANIGSKRKRRRRPTPKSLELTNTKRSAAVPKAHDVDVLPTFPAGKKGRKFAKKFLERTVAKAERRKNISEE
jgi:hypothetical protein